MNTINWNEIFNHPDFELMRDVCAVNNITMDTSEFIHFWITGDEELDNDMLEKIKPVMLPLYYQFIKEETTTANMCVKK